MKKNILLTLIFILTLTLPCYAEIQEVTAEGTYFGTENDSPAQGEEAALLIAKRAAIEQLTGFLQSSTNITVPQLKDDQVRALANIAIETTILDKSRTYNGQNMVYWVKIKTNINTDKLIETIKYGSSIGERQLMGVVTIVDLPPGAKFDANIIDNNKYDFSQFTQHFHIADPFNQAIANKYSSRSLVAETPDILVNYFTNEYMKNKQLTSASFATISDLYKYDYIWVNVLKFDRIERVTGSAFFTFEMKIYWQIDSTINSYLYNTRTNKLTINDSYTTRKEGHYGAGTLISTPPANIQEKTIEAVLRDVSHSLIDQVSRKLPNI